VAVVPPSLRASTPLALRATGLRLLPRGAGDAVLAEARAALEPHGFKDAGVQVLKAEEEGECEWLTVNFLMGTFRPGVQAVTDPVAVVDLAADSVQVAYFLKDADAAEAKRRGRSRFVRKLALPLGSGYAHLYQHDYLGHGLMTARVEALREVEGLGAAQGGHPCLPSGEVVTLRHGGRDLRGRGAGDAAKCTALATAILRHDKDCNQDGWGRCTIAGNWGGPGFQQRLVLKSFFYDRMIEAGVLGTGTPNETMAIANFTQAARRACEASARGLEAVVAAHPQAPKEVAPWMCFDLSYMAALLSRGFGLDAARRAIVAKKILYDGRLFEASWALGMSIKSTKRVAR